MGAAHVWGCELAQDEEARAATQSDMAVADIDDMHEPTLEMAKRFAVFLFKTRQRRSKIGRHGLGDSVAEMAQYTLAQVCCSVTVA